MPKIKSITCHKALDSRGTWTIETKVVLEDESFGVQVVPAGASKGENEAVYLPVEKAEEIVDTAINDALVGEEALEQFAIDNVMLSIDGTPNKHHLGGNSILSVSLAVCKACSMSKRIELYEYLSYLYNGKYKSRKDLKFPTPVFNLINGGKHAHNNLSFQEFMVIPAQSLPYDKALEMGVSIDHSLVNLLTARGYDVAVGDEGGCAPGGLTTEKALGFIIESAQEKYKPGKDVFLGLDVASESFYIKDKYEIIEEKLSLNQQDFLGYFKSLIKKFPLIYIEDPYYERDTEGWKLFYNEMNKKLLVVADDLVVTNKKFLKKAIDQKLANAVIVKPNQVGTLTETFDFIKMAKENNMSICVSHRSGDTAEDTFIADLALAVGADFIKAGAPVRGERVAKYNRLLDIFYS